MNDNISQMHTNKYEKLNLFFEFSTYLCFVFSLFTKI